MQRTRKTRINKLALFALLPLLGGLISVIHAVVAYPQAGDYYSAHEALREHNLAKRDGRIVVWGEDQKQKDLEIQLSLADDQNYDQGMYLAVGVLLLTLGGVLLYLGNRPHTATNPPLVYEPADEEPTLSFMLGLEHPLD